MYKVVTDNIGIIDSASDYRRAKKLFDDVVKRSKTGVGVLANQHVYLYYNSILKEEYNSQTKTTKKDYEIK